MDYGINQTGVGQIYRGGAVDTASAIGPTPSLSDALDNFGRDDDYARVLVERMRALRDRLTGGRPDMKAGADVGSPAPSVGQVQRAFMLRGSLNQQLNLLDSLITEVQQALG